MAGSAVTLALPALGRDLDVSVESSRWVLQVYLLAIGVLLLLAGRLSDLLGYRRVYLAGFALFGVGALCCGLAPNMPVLVAFRVLQGAGGAMLMATAPALITTAVPAARRGRALGLLATCTYLGLTIGPPVGGAIVSAVGWRWTFHFMVPVSLVVTALGLRFLPVIPRTTGDDRRLDVAGALALLIGLPLVLLALSEGPVWGYASWKPWVSGVTGLAALAAMVAAGRRAVTPLLDLSLFRSRLFTSAMGAAVTNYVALFVVILLLPFYLEEGLGRSPASSGLVLSVQSLTMALVASPSGWLSDRLGSRGLATGGLLVLALGLGGLSTVGADSTTATVVAWIAVVGLGTGVFISPNSSALMGAAPRHLQGTAGSVLAEARVVGMLLGVVLGSAVFHAMGGQTGTTWRPEDFAAMHLALRAAAATALLGALFASLRGRRPYSQRP